MRKKAKKIDPLPEEFSSIEEASEFWDEHDSMDYPNAFSDVDVEVDLKGRKCEIDIDEDVMKMLRARARERGARPGRLASNILRKELSTADR